MIIDAKQYAGLCSCGREHQMATAFSVVEAGCLPKLRDYMQANGLSGKTVAVYDENTYAACTGKRPVVDEEIILNPEGLHADEHGVALLQARLPKDAQILVAVGSGTIHDITRYCAYEAHSEFVSCPTAASVDGFCSSVAAMTWKGCKRTLTAVAPKLVVADLEIIKNAPLRLARSGFGDMIGKYVALADWRMAHAITGEFHCARIADMMAQATRTVQESAPGIAAGEEEAYEKLMYGLLLSGLAMQLMGNSRPASGAEHHISHLIEMHPAGIGVQSDALHGEKVGVGTLLALREYKRLANTEPCWQDYASWQRSELEGPFADLTEEVLNENARDVAAGITAQQLASAWETVRQILRELPDPAQLEATYNALGVKATLASIDVDEQKLPLLLRYAPCVRNRLTLMRLTRCMAS